MKFIESNYGYDWSEGIGKCKETKSNGSFLHIIIYLILLIVTFSIEEKQLSDYEFEKEPFVSVQSWDKEVYMRNTFLCFYNINGVSIINLFVP